MRKLLAAATASAAVATALGVGALAPTTAAAAAAADAPIPAFGDFIASVRAATPAQLPALAGSKAPGEPALAEMKAHVLDAYAAVKPADVKHSFLDEADQVFDCIPTAQQPALQGASGPVPTAPDMPRAAAGGGAAGPRAPVAGQLGHGRKDRLGNAVSCATGTIPMRRETLEGLTRFDSLKSYLRKSPLAEGPELPPSGAVPPAAAATHRYAHAYQFASNLGGHSFISVWDPPIGANQIFSLSQQWYSGGSGTGLQTAEVGWQVYPQFYNTTKPVFFIYYTADGYHNTGCYNLTCKAFVQTSNAWTIGGAISPWSTVGGTQRVVEVSYYLNGGRWWLYVNGTGSANAIGYYPASLYGAGVLATRATEIDYGGETVGTTSWPPMGSGQFASAGPGKAAYQRTIYYYPTAGGATYAKLTPSQGWPTQYTISVQNLAAPWYETIYFGGPGGS